MKVKPNAQPNQSLIDGIATLQALAASPAPVGNRELARQLGFDATRVNRLLKTLAYLGIARQTANRKYTSGPGMHVLAAQSLFASGLIRNALPVLEKLRRFGHTVALGVLWRDNVSYLFHAPPTVETAQGLGRIGLLPASSSGIGMALLAQYDDEYVAGLYADKEEIPSFPGGLPALLAALAQVRAQGYSRVAVGPDLDRHTIAVTVENIGAAVGVSGWIPEANTDLIVEALRQAAQEIRD
ncbi:IclR family transcriptional regulator [Niveispirillum sp. KHB5.9]|uniref:IclR family transcriptional regulator n=1 Tax=Niveispirillum sp. KHB5.9 TaxID=3400269 RepID=UPI003A868D5F